MLPVLVIVGMSKGKTMRISDSELYGCKNCRVFDPENQMSTRQNLERDPNYYDDAYIVMVCTGRTFYGRPVYVDLLLCDRHAGAERKEDSKRQ